ncbi:MAG: tRNA (5-methylaminomethyl-2-thiouridine)(34)-methyltransferase MnmD, partial [Caulobacteraceae bacterium]
MADAWPSPAIFEAGAPPRSRRYGDVYFSKEGGLAQARAVFLEGCGLPDGWRGRRRFVVAELGFGTGLNIAALLQAWSASRTDGAHLSIFSVEAEPLPPDEAKRALSAWPELAGEAEALLAAWPGRRRGFHRVDLPGHGATLDVAVMEVEAALEAWSGRADAWFLDGFSPALNPAMWTGALMRLVAQRSAPGARAATYSVAGQVRGALEEAACSLERRPGFGAKRQRLEARLPGDAAAETLAPRVTIVGAGIAGASLARAYRALGCEVRVLERAAPGAGASGNPSALVTPRLDAGAESIARLHAQALDRAVRLYEREPGVVLARRVLQFEAGARDHSRFARIAASDVFGPGALAQLSAEEVGAALGEPAPPALALETALAVRPAAILETWLAEV